MKPLTIYDNLALDAGTSGYLDWATGISRINVSIAEWEEFRNRPVGQLPPRQRDLAEAIAHEHVHFAQITTTGYLYRFATLLYALLLRCVPQPTFTVPSPDLKPPPEVASQFASLLDALDRVGTTEITIRTIIESQAFYLQKMSTLQGLNHKYYLEMLDDAPGPEYRRAYDLAAEWLGARAFGTFPALASLALCTNNPDVSFFSLVKAAAARKLNYTRATRIARFMTLANEVSTDWLGFPADLADRLPQHPVYTSAALKIDELCGETSQSSALTFLTELHKARGKFVSAMLRPLMFNRTDGSNQTPLILPGGLWADKTPEEKDNEGHNLIVIAAISASFLGNIESPNLG